MVKIQVGTSDARGFKPGSWLIKLFQWTSYSHVYFKFYSENLKETMIYQASHGLVNFFGLNNFLSENRERRIFEIEITEEAYRRILKRCVQLAGAKYSKIQLIGYPLITFLGKNPFDEKGKYVCSELCAEILLDLGYNFEKDLPSILPKDIVKGLEALSKIDKRVKIVQ